MSEAPTPDVSVEVTFEYDEDVVDRPPLGVVDGDDETIDDCTVLFDQLVDVFAGFIQLSTGDDLENVSNDAFLHVVSKAASMCDEFGVPRSDRSKWIIPAFRVAMYGNTDESVGELTNQLTLMLDL